MNIIERKTNAGANKQFLQILKDRANPPYNVPPPPKFGTEEKLIQKERDLIAQERYSREVTFGEYEHSQNSRNVEAEPQKVRRSEFPFFLKLPIAFIAFMAAGSTGSEVFLLIVGVIAFCWLFL